MPKYLQSILSFSVCLLCSWNIYAAIYKSTDPQGNTSYSDQPTETNLQPITLMPLSTMDGFTPSMLLSSPTENNAFTSSASEYNSLTLLSPMNEQTIWDNNGELIVRVAMSSPLQPGDTLQIILDNKIIADSRGTLQVDLRQITRGTHTLQAQILNKSDQICKVSQVVVFYMHKTIK